jgi:hypothetical protein
MRRLQWSPSQQCCSRHDLARLAIAALRCLLSDPRRDNAARVLRQTFDRDKPFAHHLGQGRHAGVTRLAIDVNGTDAAYADAAAVFCALKSEIFAEDPQQWRIESAANGTFLAVYIERDHEDFFLSGRSCASKLDWWSTINRANLIGMRLPYSAWRMRDLVQAPLHNLHESCTQSERCARAPGDPTRSRYIGLHRSVTRDAIHYAHLYAPQAVEHVPADGFCWRARRLRLLNDCMPVLFGIVHGHVKLWMLLFDCQSSLFSRSIRFVPRLQLPVDRNIKWLDEGRFAGLSYRGCRCIGSNRLLCFPSAL